MRKVIVKIIGGVNMLYSKLKILFCLTVCLTILFAPFLLEISQDGKAYAMGWLGGSGGNDGSSGSRAVISTPEPKEEPGASQPSVHPTPEPATWLLVGAGAAGVAVLRKKFKKK